MAAEEHQSPRSVHDRLVRHETFLVQRGEARDVAGVLFRRDDAAPGDLEGHPDRLAARGAHHLAGDVADDPDVAFRAACVLPRWVGDRIDVGAGDVEGGPVGSELSRGAHRGLEHDHGMVGVGLPQSPVGTHEPGRRHPDGPVRVRRLIDAFPRTERRMALELPDDLREHLLPGREFAFRQVGHVAELHPAMKAVRCSRVQHLALRRDLLIERRGTPVVSTGADPAGAAGRDCGQGILSIRRLRAEGRPVREDEREDLARLDDQRAGPAIDSDNAHRRPGTHSMSASFAPMGTKRSGSADARSGSLIPNASSSRATA